MKMEVITQQFMETTLSWALSLGVIFFAGMFYSEKLNKGGNMEEYLKCIVAIYTIMVILGFIYIKAIT